MPPAKRYALLQQHMRPDATAASSSPPGPAAAASAAGLAVDLTGRVALVTGATGQLGRAMVRVLATAGADIAVHYRGNQGKADELCAQVQAMGRRSCAVHGMIDDEQSVAAIQVAIAAELGHVDIVVANAVQQYEWTSVMEQAISDYESQFRTCVLQNVLLAKAFVPGMAERGWGRIVAISSVCAMECASGQSAYDSGKRGMDGVLRVLAREVGPQGITVVRLAHHGAALLLLTDVKSCLLHHAAYTRAEYRGSRLHLEPRPCRRTGSEYSLQQRQRWHPAPAE